MLAAGLSRRSFLNGCTLFRRCEYFGASQDISLRCKWSFGWKGLARTIHSTICNAKRQNESMVIQENPDMPKYLKKINAKISQMSSFWFSCGGHDLKEEEFEDAQQKFKKYLNEYQQLDPEINDIIMRIATKQEDVEALRPHFLAFVNQGSQHLERLKHISDLSNPAFWFPAARDLKRKFIFHAGPTNSGKTHEALQRFFSSKSGVYCAPLRMLAAEIHQRCNSEGVPCDLLTGEEKVTVGEFEAPHISCTVEMCNTGKEKTYDVGIIDEVQMLKDSERGSAWTRALLGLPAREIHLCGSSAAISVVQRVLATTEEELEIKMYDRLSPLKVSRRSLRDAYSDIREGDCIVAFSRKHIFAIKQKVESATGYQCAVVYGGLPSATRLEQSRLFNDPNSNFKVLVATDAIGMGLNLNIRRIIFHSIEKWSGQDILTLSSSHLKQIAGRAGRYQSQFPDGLVTTFKQEDFQSMKKLFSVPEADIQQAGLSPQYEQIELFAKYLPRASFSDILVLFHKFATLDGLYFLCDIDDEKLIAERLKGVNLSMYDTYTFCHAPIYTKEDILLEAISTFARIYSNNKAVGIDTVKDLIKQFSNVSNGNYLKMRQNEIIHELLDLYLWLSMRYPLHFPHHIEVRSLQKKIEASIGRSLKASSKQRMRKPQSQSLKHSNSQKINQEAESILTKLTHGRLTASERTRLYKSMRKTVLF